jgi:cell division septum initiation protein DivIVA
MSTPQPQWQPISMLPKITTHIDGMLEAAQEQYQTLLPAKARPHALDDYTVNRVIKVFTEQQQDLWLFDEQLLRWSKTTLSAQQRKEVERLQGQMKKLREQIATILALADELAKRTIEKVMAQSDAELGLEFLLHPNRF